MTVILRDTVPPIIEVTKLGYTAVAVYSLLGNLHTKIYAMTKEDA